MAEEKQMPTKQLGGESRRIVRLLSTDVPGDLSLQRSLIRIKGISFMFAHAICVSLNMDKKKKIGVMSTDELKKIENFVKTPELPLWMLNRRKDTETGSNMHLVMASLDLKKMEDINTLRKIRAYKGVRHELGLPVRGQRTRSSFRKNKTMGVSKRKAMPGKAAPAAPPPAKK